MRPFVVALILGMASPAWAIDKNLTTTIPAIMYGIFDTENNGIVGRAITTDYVLKLKCRGNTAITLTGTPTEIASGYYEMAPTNTVAVVTNYDWEDECIYWGEGAGAYAGLIAMAPEKFKAVAPAPERYAVLADAGNGTSSFKTTIPYTLNIPGGGGGSQRWVIRFDATPTCNVAGVIATVSTFNPTTDFLTLVEPLPSGTIPTTGCEFEVVF